MARIEPAPGATVEEVKRTRVISPALEEKPGEGLDFWEYQASIKPDDWQNHIIYVYRWLENGEREAVGKYAQPIDEFFLREKHGGGCYKLLLKRGQQIWKTCDKCRVEGPPKPYSPTQESAAPARATESGDSDPLNRLCNLLERVIMRNDSSAVQGEALRSALQLQSEGFRSVVTNVRDMAPTPPAPPSGNPLMDKLMEAMIAKMLNPADPIENFAKMATAMKAIGFGGEAKASIGAELVRTVGASIPQIVDGVKSYTNAVSKQAELQILVLQRQATAPAPARPAAAAAPQPAQNAPAPAIPSAAPAADNNSQGETRVAITIEDVEKHIAYLIMRDDISAADAAEKTLDYLQDISPKQLYPYICGLSEIELTAFINSRPILSQVPKNPRFSEFVKKVVELAHREEPDNSSTQSPQTPA